jgi:hypothetical protein
MIDVNVPYVLDYVEKSLKENGIKYEVHSFPSGACMIDVWFGKNFYVLQLTFDYMGISLANAPALCTIPEESYVDYNEFKTRFESVFQSKESKFQ